MLRNERLNVKTRRLLLARKPKVTEMLILPKLADRFSAITIKILARDFVEIYKPILKFTWKSSDLEVPE